MEKKIVDIINISYYKMAVTPEIDHKIHGMLSVINIIFNEQSVILRENDMRQSQRSTKYYCP